MLEKRRAEYLKQKAALQRTRKPKQPVNAEESVLPMLAKQNEPIDARLKRQFQAIMEAEDNTVNRALRQYIAAYVAEHRVKTQQTEGDVIEVPPSR